jgi:cyclophilin family peptidyl-prolyl cis-trans isomerase
MVTDRVSIEIKIANYTEESVGTNKGADGSGTIVIGLYGKHAPQSVKLFLDTVMGNGIDTPDYINAQFQRVTPQGLLEMDSVRGMNAISIAGSSQYEYRGKVLSGYKPILESPDDGLLVHHDKMGLLTHRQLSSTPEFSITLKDDPSREDVDELDAFHCVFGEVVEGRAVLEAIAAVPLYTYETKTGYAGGEKGVESALADKWFAAQRNFYVNMGKSLGDDRAVDMRGKLLKRTVIKKVTKL